MLRRLLTCGGGNAKATAASMAMTTSASSANVVTSFSSSRNETIPGRWTFHSDQHLTTCANTCNFHNTARAHYLSSSPPLFGAKRPQPKARGRKASRSPSRRVPDGRGKEQQQQGSSNKPGPTSPKAPLRFEEITEARKELYCMDDAAIEKLIASDVSVGLIGWSKGGGNNAKKGGEKESPSALVKLLRRLPRHSNQPAMAQIASLDKGKKVDVYALSDNVDFILGLMKSRLCTSALRSKMQRANNLRTLLHSILAEYWTKKSFAGSGSCSKDGTMCLDDLRCAAQCFVRMSTQRQREAALLVPEARHVCYNAFSAPLKHRIADATPRSLGFSDIRLFLQCLLHGRDVDIAAQSKLVAVAVSKIALSANATSSGGSLGDQLAALDDALEFVALMSLDDTSLTKSNKTLLVDAACAALSRLTSAFQSGAYKVAKLFDDGEHQGAIEDCIKWVNIIVKAHPEGAEELVSTVLELVQLCQREEKLRAASLALLLRAGFPESSLQRRRAMFSDLDRQQLGQLCEIVARERLSLPALIQRSLLSAAGTASGPKEMAPVVTVLLRYRVPQLVSLVAAYLKRTSPAAIGAPKLPSADHSQDDAVMRRYADELLELVQIISQQFVKREQLGAGAATASAEDTPLSDAEARQSNGTAGDGSSSLAAATADMRHGVCQLLLDEITTLDLSHVPAGSIASLVVSLFNLGVKSGSHNATQQHWNGVLAKWINTQRFKTPVECHAALSALSHGCNFQVDGPNSLPNTATSTLLFTTIERLLDCFLTTASPRSLTVDDVVNTITPCKELSTEHQRRGWSSQPQLLFKRFLNDISGLFTDASSVVLGRAPEPSLLRVLHIYTEAGMASSELVSSILNVLAKRRIDSESTKHATKKQKKAAPTKKNKTKTKTKTKSVSPSSSSSSMTAEQSVTLLVDVINAGGEGINAAVALASHHIKALSWGDSVAIFAALAEMKLSKAEFTEWLAERLLRAATEDKLTPQCLVALLSSFIRLDFAVVEVLQPLFDKARARLNELSLGDVGVLIGAYALSQCELPRLLEDVSGLVLESKQLCSPEELGKIVKGLSYLVGRGPEAADCAGKLLRACILPVLKCSDRLLPADVMRVLSGYIRARIAHGTLYGVLLAKASEERTLYPLSDIIKLAEYGEASHFDPAVQRAFATVTKPMFIAVVHQTVAHNAGVLTAPASANRLLRAVASLCPNDIISEDIVKGCIGRIASLDHTTVSALLELIAAKTHRDVNSLRELLHHFTQVLLPTLDANATARILASFIACDVKSSILFEAANSKIDDAFVNELDDVGLIKIMSVYRTTRKLNDVLVRAVPKRAVRKGRSMSAECCDAVLNFLYTFRVASRYTKLLHVMSERLVALLPDECPLQTLRSAVYVLCMLNTFAGGLGPKVAEKLLTQDLSTLDVYTTVTFLWCLVRMDENNPKLTTALLAHITEHRRIVLQRQFLLELLKDVMNVVGRDSAPELYEAVKL